MENPLTDYPLTYESTGQVDKRRLLNKPLFGMGRLLATPAAMNVMLEAKCHPAELLQRHQCGDWGDLCMSDQNANMEALVTGGRLLSVYRVAGVKLYCVTEAVNDATQRRDCTTTLLPSEW